MNNKKLLIIPIAATSLLLGAKPDVTPVTFLDKFHYAIISPGQKGYLTNISFNVSFSTINSANYVQIYKFKPLTLEYILIGEYQNKNFVINETLDVLEPYTKQDYSECGLLGPRFFFKIQFNNYVLERYFDTKYRDYENTETLDFYEKDSRLLPGSVSAFYYDGANDYKTTIEEAFTTTSYTQDALYEFDNQNYIDFDRAIFSNSIKKDNKTFKVQLTSSGAYLEINDVNNYFPNLHLSRTDSTVIILGELIPFKDGMGFKVTDNLYIDPLTRITYRTNRIGRIKVNRLYFPIGVKRKESEVSDANQIKIFVERAGYSKSRLKFTFNMGDFGHDIIGDCATNEYCVQFDNSEPNFDIGDQVIYD